MSEFRIRVKKSNNPGHVLGRLGPYWNKSWIQVVISKRAGKTYRFRISNVGTATSINFRIAGHKLKLVEIEGTHTLQTTYSSLDIHLGQSYSVLVTADQAPDDYYVAVSTRFTNRVLTNTAVLHYRNSWKKVSGPIPGAPTTQIGWSINQAKSFRYIHFHATP